VVGHLLTRSWQREQERLDNKKQEYRELMTAMADAYTQLLRLGSGVVADSREVQAEIDSARFNSHRAIHDRIYIAETIKKMRLFENWTAETTIFVKDQERIRFTERFLKLQAQVREAAIEDTQPTSCVSRIMRHLRKRSRKSEN
jgi:hypothetical protein